MTRDNIVRMATASGLLEPDYVHGEQVLSELEHFAALVAAAERQKHQADIERWKAEAAKAEKWRALALAKDGNGRTVQVLQAEARAEEREACACDVRFADNGTEAEEIIRARGNP